MVDCARCGTSNPDSVKFCHECGASLAESQLALGEERKVVSVLFVDLVGFTARSHDADPEDIRAALSPYYRRLKREIERFGGTVEKFIGDAVAAVFGAPIVHEDDAERAVRAALRITEVIGDLNDSNSSFELAIRAAVNTGETVVSLNHRPEAGEGMVTGDIVNTASRLQAIAPVGGVVVGERTYRTTRRSIDYEALEPVTVKGKPEPVPVFRAVSARALFGIDVEEKPSTPFLGRDHDLDTLKSAFARTLRESSVQLVTVVGVPGIGKTRLLTEFRTFVDDQTELVYWRQGRSLPYGEGITFWALGEIFKAHAGILSSDQAEIAQKKLREMIESFVEDPSEHDWFVHRLSPLVGASLEEVGRQIGRQEFFTAWRRLIEAMAARHPIVLVFEDLHWADPELLDFINYLEEWSSGMPILILSASRPDLFDQHPNWAGGKRNAVTLGLSPLHQDEMAELISALWDKGQLPEGLRASLLDRAGGNPLYAEESVRMLAERESIQDAPNLLAMSATDLPLPDSVHALIAARLDALAAALKALLQDASVVGKVFWESPLESMAPSLSEPVAESLHQLAGKELVRSARKSSIEGEHEYSFRHAVIRDVCYGEIPRSSRARKHRAVAEWIEAMAGDRATDYAELLAHHYGTALTLARASRQAEEARVLEASACRFLLMAGDRTQPLNPGKAETYYQNALGLLEKSDPDWALALAKATEVSWLLGHSSAAETEVRYEDAIEALLAHGNRLCAGETMVKLSRVLWEQGATLKTRSALAAAVDMLDAEPAGRELVYACAQTTGERWASGLPQECLKWAARSLELAESLGISDQATLARGYRGCARCDLGDPGGLEDLREAVDQAVDSGFGREAGIHHNNLGYLVWLIEGPSKALAIDREGLDFAHRRGLVIEARWLKLSSIEALYDLGEWDELLSVADEIIGVSGEVGAGQAALLALIDKAAVFRWTGADEDARGAMKELMIEARRHEDPKVRVRALTVSCLIARDTGDVATVAALSAELAEAITAPSLEWVRCLTDTVTVLVTTGRAQVVTELLPRIPTAYPRYEHSLLTSRAIVIEAEGDYEEAAGLYEEAAGRWGRYGSALERGRALVGRSRCLAAAGRAGEAGGSLNEAHTILSRLGATPLVAEIDALQGP